MFLRKTRIEPLPVTMSAVRMGERVLQIGVDDATVAIAIAAKVGLSGHAAIAVSEERDAARAQSAMTNAGILVDVRVTPLAALPFDSDAFDFVVIHAMHGLIASLAADARIAAMREWRRVLRQGGRAMTIEAGPASGLAGVLRRASPNESYDVVGALEASGFKPARVLAEREGYKFAEGIKSG
jgi:ubiquinone/menaquinone biosynthesis C-methylase UbiE